MPPAASDIFPPDFSKEMSEDYARRLYKDYIKLSQQLEEKNAQIAEYERRIAFLEKQVDTKTVPNEYLSVAEMKKRYDLSFLWQTKGPEAVRNMEMFYKIMKSCGRKAEVCRRLAEYNGIYFNFGRFSNKQKAVLVNQFSADFGFPPFTDEDFKKNWSSRKK